MNSLMQILLAPGWTSLVMALLHSLWLGVCWVLIMGACLRFCGNHPKSRYFTGLASLLGFVLSVFVSWSVQQGDWKPRRAESATSITSTQERAATIVNGQAAVQSADAAIPWANALALLWAAGSAVMLVRLAVKLCDSERVRRESTLLEHGPLVELLRELQKMLGYSRIVRIATNALVQAPSVSGVFTPMILLPASMLTGVPMEHLRAILLHEIAHIRRHDYLVNLFQEVIGAFLFFNPALWWINRQIRLEREACCDLLAVQVTSQHSYAEALAGFAARTHAALGSLHPAFPGDREPSSLLERMRRLLVAGYRPVVRLPWHSSVVVLFCAGVLLFGTWRGTRFAVTVAAELLSPEQRIQRIAALKAEVGPVERSYSSQDDIILEGRVRTEDGGPLPKGISVSVHVSNPQHSSGYGGLPLTNGHFRWKGHYGTVYLSAWNAGTYAPAFLGPLLPEPGGALTNLQLVLAKGYRSGFRVTDTQGEPLAGVNLEGTYTHPTGSVPVKLVTDTNGVATLEHCIKLPMRWTARLPGFQSAIRANITLQPDSSLDWELQPAEATSGRIVSKSGGGPIAGAQIKLMHRAGGFTASDENSAELLAVSDSRGEFRIDSLPEKAAHIMVVTAPGHGTKIVRDVYAGQSGLRVELGPELYVRGTIRGDLSQLNGMPEPVIYVTNPLKLNDSSTHLFNHRVPVEVLDENNGRFEVANVWEGELRISIGPKTFEYVIREPKTNLVVDLVSQPDAPARELRAMVIRFRPPANAPAVKGHLEVTRASLEDGTYRSEYVPIVQNEARFEAPVGTAISWSTRAIIGYWTAANHHQQVTPGRSAQEIELPVFAAGAIHGVVRNADGSDTGGVMITVLEKEPAPGKERGLLGGVGKNRSAPNDSPTRFVAQPLPLGGTYVLIASRGNQYVASEPVVIDEKNPIREVELRLVEGEALTGVVTDEAGLPLANIPISLNYNSSYQHAFGIVGFESDRAPKTDVDGRFSIAQLNPDVPGSYQVIIDHANGYQPIAVTARIGSPVRISLKKAEKLSGIVVNDATGKPLAGAKFYVLAAEMTPGDFGNVILSDAASDRSGRFEFSRLQPREYNLYSNEGEIMGERKIRIPVTESKPFTVRLKPHTGARLWEEGELLSAQR